MFVVVCCLLLLLLVCGCALLFVFVRRLFVVVSRWLLNVVECGLWFDIV